MDKTMAASQSQDMSITNSANLNSTRESSPNSNNSLVFISNTNEIVESILDVENAKEDDNPFASKKRKKTSKVWNEFKEVTLPNGTTKAECIHYKHRLALNKTGATTQFLRHLKCCIQRVINLKGQQQINITNRLNETESIAALENFRYNHAKIREVFSHMILVHELLFNFVEYEIFNLLMKYANSSFQKISRAILRKDIDSSYDIEKKKIKELLAGVPRLSVTTDLWKSDAQKISYMVVTAHFVDSDFKLQKRILNFCDIPPPHNEIIVCDALQKCFQEWEIENKVWTVTVDNATYNDVAIRILKENLSFSSSLPLSLCGKLFHVRYCAHILNLLVQDGLSEIQDIIHNVSESIKHITASEARIQMFSEIVKQLKLPLKKLILDVSTRWNATYLMLIVALEYKDVFPRYQIKDLSYCSLPSQLDWKKVKEVCVFLKEFYEVTNIISGSEYPTSNLFLLELYNVKRKFSEIYASDDETMKNMVKKMKKKFDKYWGDCNLLIALAAVMDPRSKMKSIEIYFPLIYSRVDSFEHIATISESLHLLYTEYIEAYRTENANKESKNELAKEGSSVASVGKEKGRKSDFFFHLIRSGDAVVEHAKLELYIYLEEGIYVCENDEAFDALEWWSANKLKYKILSRMTSDILSIPITTVASEATFSAGGRVIDSHRASLETDTVKKLLCGEDWFQAYYGLQRKKNESTTKDIREYIIP